MWVVCTAIQPPFRFLFGRGELFVLPVRHSSYPTGVSQGGQKRACILRAHHFIAGVIVVSKDKVVSIDQLRQRREERQMQQSPESAQLPSHIEQALEAENQKVLAVFKTLDEALSKYSKNNAFGSVLVPIEALARMILSAATSIDRHLPEQDQIDQIDFRNELSEGILDVINIVIEDRQLMGQTKIYKHDVYIALIMALLSSLFEHRIVQIQLEKKGVASRVEPSFTDDSNKG
jgi:hypothetical protein